MPHKQVPAGDVYSIPNKKAPEVGHKAGPQEGMYAVAAKPSKVSNRSAGVLTGDMDPLEMLSCGLIGDRHSSDMNVSEASINSNDDRLKFKGAYVTRNLCLQAGNMIDGVFWIHLPLVPVYM